MANIEINDMNENEKEKEKEEVTLTEEEIQHVKGGPAFLKLGDIKGEARVFPKVEATVFPKVESNVFTRDNNLLR